MRIAVVCPPLTGRGGMETCLRNLAEGSERAGHEVRLLALSPSRVDSGWQAGLPYEELTGGGGSALSQLTAGAVALSRVFRRFRPDVAISLYPSSIAVIRLAELLSLHRVKLASWLHFPLHRSEKVQLLRAADVHLCISSGIMAALEQRLGTPRRQMALVYNGVRLDTPDAPARSSPGEPLQLVHIGRLHVGGQKRTDDILRAMARVQGCHCHFVGAGEVEALQALAEELGVADRCRWTGWREAPWSEVATADALVLSSGYEAFGMILIEALARGVPCISSDCDVGPSDIVRPGVNGWLYPPGDVSALAGLIARAVEDRSALPTPDAVKASAEPFHADAVTRRILDAVG